MNEFKIFTKISDDLKKNIKYFHVFNRGDSVLFVTIDDKVFGFGWNSNGMLGFGHQIEVKSECEIIELRNQGITRFHIGWGFVIAIKSNKLFSWGKNNFGQLGRGYANNEISKPSSVEMFDNIIIKQIDIYENSIAILTDDRKVYVWGSNRYKQCDDYNDFVITPIEKRFPQGVIIESIFVFFKNSFAISFNGNVYIWGENNYFPKEILLGVSKPRLINSIRNVKYIGFNDFKTFFLTNDKNIYVTKNFDCFEEVNCLGHVINKIITYKGYQDGNNNSWLIDISNAVYNISFIHNDLCFVEKSMFDNYVKEHVTFETIELKKIENIKQVIGHGVFGKVFKSVRYGREYAIKKIYMIKSNRDLMDKNSEINIMWKLSSEYIANLYDYWTDKTNDGDEFLYMQMELCDCNLKDFFNTINNFKNLPDEIIFIIEIEILKQVFESVNYLHLNKVIHRDLKPSNILFKYNSSNGRFIKLCDFGLSMNHEWSSMTHTSNVGTNNYIAPEVKHGGKYSEKADIYSLGIIMEKDFKLLSINKFDSFGNLKELERLKNLFIENDPKNRPKLDEIINFFNNFYLQKFINFPKYIICGFIHYESNNYPDEIIKTLRMIEQYSNR